MAATGAVTIADSTSATYVVSGTKGETLTITVNFTDTSAALTAGATTELAKITDVSVTYVPNGTINDKTNIEAAMLTIANEAVADGYTVTIAAGSTYDVDTMVWVGKFVVTDDATAANTKTDGTNRTITVV